MLIVSQGIAGKFGSINRLYGIMSVQQVRYICTLFTSGAHHTLVFPKSTYVEVGEMITMQLVAHVVFWSIASICS